MVAVARSAGPRADLPEAARCIALDIAKATSPADWLPHLAGIDAVVNCAGVLQDSPRDSTAGVHTRRAPPPCLPPASRRACGAWCRCRRSASTASAATAFARSKRAGDQALMARDLEWVMLRPSVVVGRQAYGGSALFRGLAALPIVPRVRGDRAVADRAARRPRAHGSVLPASRRADPRRSRDRRARGACRSMRCSPPIAAGSASASRASCPCRAGRSHAAFRIGDLIGLLGWRPPLRSTTRAEIGRGAIGDPGPWQRLTGIAPRTLGAALAAEPASVQERWFARLYFLKPVMLAALSLYWIVTGLMTLGPGWEEGVDLIERARLAAAAPLAAAGAIADLLIGVGIAIRRTAKVALLAGAGAVASPTWRSPRCCCRGCGPIRWAASSRCCPSSCCTWWRWRSWTTADDAPISPSSICTSSAPPSCSAPGPASPSSCCWRTAPAMRRSWPPSPASS